MNTKSRFELKPLPYGYDALEPFIDANTVEMHYCIHHKAYYENFMNAIKGTSMEMEPIHKIFEKISKKPEIVRNNSGGHFNHTLYWESMKAYGGGRPSGKLSDGIGRAFDSFEKFKKQFTEAGTAMLGCGWAWLCLDEKGNLFVCSTPHHDNPLMDTAEKRGVPLLVLDVWDHAYHLKYRNKRPEYIEAFWNVVNWEVVSGRYEDAFKSLPKNTHHSGFFKNRLKFATNEMDW